MSELREIKISYSVGCKVNLGNYENVDMFFSETETYGVEGLTDKQLQKFRDEKYGDMRIRLDEAMLKARNEISS